MPSPKVLTNQSAKFVFVSNMQIKNIGRGYWIYWIAATDLAAWRSTDTQ